MHPACCFANLKQEGESGFHFAATRRERNVTSLCEKFILMQGCVCVGVRVCLCETSEVKASDSFPLLLIS